MICLQRDPRASELVCQEWVATQDPSSRLRGPREPRRSGSKPKTSEIQDSTIFLAVLLKHKSQLIIFIYFIRLQYKHSILQQITLALELYTCYKYPLA